LNHADDAPHAAPGRWGQLLRGFCCQNVAVGCAFGGFGVAVLPMQEKFGVDRGLATLGLPLVVLAMGIASPLAATLIGRIGLRRTMLLGVLLSAIGYLAIALAPSFPVVLAAYALPVGVGAALFGSFPASVLASNWFQPQPGRAVGFVNMPLFVALLPTAGIAMIERGGLTGLYLLLAALHLLLLPIVLGVVDGPAAHVSPRPDAASPIAAEAPITQRALLGQPLFWMIVVGAGLLNSAGITGSAHLFAFAREAGGTAAQAGLVVSLQGGASMVGSLLIGFVCDRIGAARGLALTAAGLMLSWLALFLMPTIAVMSSAGLLIGMCGAGVFPAVNVLAGHLYGPAALARVIGLFGLLTLPLTFVLPPLGGVLHDATGGYAAVAAIIAVLAAGVAILFFAAGRIAERRLALRGAPAPAV